jgi:hypothetical protein
VLCACVSPVPSTLPTQRPQPKKHFTHPLLPSPAHPHAAPSSSPALVYAAVCLVLTHVTPPGEWPDVALWLLRQERSVGLEWPDSAASGRPGVAQSTIAASASDNWHRDAPTKAGGGHSSDHEGDSSGGDPIPVLSLFYEWKGGPETWLQRTVGATAAAATSAGGDAELGAGDSSAGSSGGLSVPGLRVCSKPGCTGAPKPDRSHHCQYCATCVLEMDHHCP